MAAVRTLWRGISIPQWLLFSSALAYGGTFGLLVAYGRPGMGISGGFYVAIILAAAATSPFAGALAGLCAVVLFELATHFSHGLAWGDFDNATAVAHLVGYTAAGLLTGFLAYRVRRMLAQSLWVLEDLIELVHEREGVEEVTAPLL